MTEFIKNGPVSVIEYLKKNYMRNEGERYGLTDESTSDELSNFLAEFRPELWDYPVDEVDHIIENEHNIVLVKCADGYRWFECIPAA